ncbi:hypothetical protein [Piscinibacter sp.]|uniref:hypothetical protein n=1 Tax=Piscinibacter sp. TaxID=1903157 RepID=UPI002C07A673|nr:hypothetical protein [Albitalea sp.]HUG26076.1 hypothetical protein [Albitalea sp.]
MNTAPKAVAMPLIATKPSWWSRLSFRFRRRPAHRGSAQTIATSSVQTPERPIESTLPAAPPPPLVETSLPRAVPVPVGALTQLLDMDATARSRLRHLALVESSCRLSSPDDPFARLPPRAAEIAVRQLDTVLPQHPALRVLRLQLERHLQSHRAHVSAMLAVEDRKWQIEGSVVSFSASLARDSVIGGPWGVTGFLETQPFETATLR